nr:HAMP domain-containing sensor histidine kinase [Spirochaeta isovalerica]
MRSLDLEEYLTEILFTLSPALKKTDIAINIDSPEEIRIITYPGAFSQIITNLIMNSINHGFDSGESGRIDISLREEEDFTVIDYRDNGKGMTEDVKSRIFEPFFTTRRNLGGTGLGLSVVYTLVTQKFQGSISCYSAPGKGTQFLLHLKSILT